MTYRTGDINFFAACMAIGIPPVLPEPAIILQNDDGRDYVSFSLDGYSECGNHITKEINNAWSNPRAFRNEFPSHPFGLLMDFISYSKGSKRKDEWIEKGAAFIGISRDAFRKALSDIQSLEANAPESPLSYVVCFIANRFAAIGWAKSAIPKVFVSKGKSVLLIDGNLPARKQKYLLDHL
jgi:hypothetical protein